MRALVVEDNAKVAGLLRAGLENEGHEVDLAADGEVGLELFHSRRPDLVLLDLGLPRIDGMEVLRQIRLASRSVPVIAVTARADVEDRVRGLDFGADDYLVKPFSIVELMARIRSLFRRRSEDGERVLEVGELSLDRFTRMARRGSETVDVSGREFQLLELFMCHPGEPLTRSMIADRIWGCEFDAATNVIDVYVNYLRKKLRLLGLQPIRTIRGVGYAFRPEGSRAAGA